MSKIDSVEMEVKERLHGRSRFDLRKFAFIGIRLVMWLAAISALVSMKNMSGVDIPEDLDPILSMLIVFGFVFCLVSVTVVCADIFNMLHHGAIYKIISCGCIAAILIWFLLIDRVVGIIILSWILLFVLFYYVDRKTNIFLRFKR